MENRDAAKAQIDITADYTSYAMRMFDLQILLGRVLDIFDASLPNKQQHSAAVSITRRQFDDFYFKVLHLTYPDGNFASSNGYAIEPMR